VLRLDDGDYVLPVVEPKRASDNDCLGGSRACQQQSCLPPGLTVRLGGDSVQGARAVLGTAILIVGVAVARAICVSLDIEITSAARLPVALGVFIVTFWSLAAMRARVARALLEAARVGVTLSFLAFASMLDTQSRRTLRYLAWVASVLIVFQALLLVAGAVSDRFGTIVFEPSVGHSLVPFSRRFRGLTNQPMNCGSATLLLIGLVGDLQSQP